MITADNDKIFLAYGTDSPQYPSFMGDYSHEHQTDGIDGSIVIITGGDLRPGSNCRELSDICIDGATNLYAEVGQRFIERVVNGLVDQQSSVVFIIPLLDSLSYEALEIARSAGLRVIADRNAAEVGDAMSCAVITGEVQMLSQLKWMDFTRDLLPYYLLVSHTEDTEFSIAAAVTALTGGNVYESIDAILLEIEREPHCILGKLGDYELLLTPTDSHARSFQINTRKTDLNAVDLLLYRHAAELSINLYDVGNLGYCGESGFYFTDFQHFEQWQPMPSSWKKVV